MQDMAEKAKELINQHLFTTTLSTVDKKGNVDVAFAHVIMADPTTIKAAQLTKRSYENLKATKKGMFMVIEPHPVKIDGICIAVELIKDETEGEDFDIMQAFVKEAFGRNKIEILLTFRITGIKPANS